MSTKEPGCHQDGMISLSTSLIAHSTTTSGKIFSSHHEDIHGLMLKTSYLFQREGECEIAVYIAAV